MRVVNTQTHPSVVVGEGTVLEPGVVVGVPPRGKASGDLVTRIGPGGWVRSGTVVYAGAVLGARLNTGHNAVIREDNVVGDDCSIGTHAVLEPGNRVGDGSRIHSRCSSRTSPSAGGSSSARGLSSPTTPTPPAPGFASVSW